MKKFVWGFAVVLLLTVFAGLYFRDKLQNPGVEKTEFLFDTYCSVSVYGHNAKEATDEVFRRLDEIHKATNFYSSESEVGKINSAKAGEVIQLSEDMCKILTVAKKIEEASGGAFDISLAPVVSLWEFDKGGRVPEKSEIKKALELVGSDAIAFDPQVKTVVKNNDDAKIDLGGAAKGYAGDVAVEILRSYGVGGAIVDLGGNICCVGKNQKIKDGKWRIGFQKPFAPSGEYDSVVELDEGSVVTSGTYQRFFEHEGKNYHHIIDPETGFPKDADYSSVTIVGKSSLYGDCLATACFVLGGDEAKELARSFGAEIYFK
ncbi:MAG: FAD:protein FMN transferase [Clostridia bacterium]|nr:FAD:protein FMN transferase [Clostridia bacterium]